MAFLFKSPGDEPGVYPIAARGRDLQHLSFTIVQLGAGLGEYTLSTGEEEVALNFYGGPVRVAARGSWGDWTVEVERRQLLRDAHPMVYLPGGSEVLIQPLDGGAKVTIAGAAARREGAPALIGREGVVTRSIGKENWHRTVHTHIAENVDAAHLICGETVTPPGNWSSCPPHKHDRFAPPSEVPMEEIYYFQSEPAQGFGFMRLYTAPDDAEPFDHAYTVEHGDTVLIPRGYHPVVACPGYTLNYAWFLAGEARQYGAWSDDPKHTWIKG